MIGGIALVDDRGLGRQDGAAAGHNAHPALTAGAAAAAGRRHEQPGIGQALHQLGADRNRELHFVVDRYRDVADRNQFAARGEDDENQQQDDGREQADAQHNLQHNCGIDVHFKSPKSP